MPAALLASIARMPAETTTARATSGLGPWPTVVAIGALACAITVLALGGFHPHAPRFHLLAQAPLAVRLHVAAAFSALVLGTIQLAGPKGTALHRGLGWAWVIIMAAVAGGSLFIRLLHPGHWSFVHIFSGVTLLVLPLGVRAARRHRIALHQRTMTSLYLGALLITGAFTFAPGRLMWRVFFG